MLAPSLGSSDAGTPAFDSGFSLPAVEVESLAPVVVEEEPTPANGSSP